MFKQEAKITKASLKDACLDDGKPKLVKGDYLLNGQKFADGTLVFCGFRGVKVAKPDVWGGVYCFDTKGSKTPEKSITVAEIEAYRAKEPTAPPATKVTHNKRKAGER